MELPDPRSRRTSAWPTVLSQFALEGDRLSAESRARLQAQMDRWLAAADQASLAQLMAADMPGAARRDVAHCLQAALDGASDVAVRLLCFAIPIVIVAGAAAATPVPMTLARPDRLRDILAKAGCLGPSEQLVFTGALCDEYQLSAQSLPRLYAMARLHPSEARPFDLIPVALPLQAGAQSVHLRFLCGSELLARGAASLRETAGEVGRWGAAFTRELAAQLATPEVTLLPLARAPAGWVLAPIHGRFCRQELAFQLEMGECLRQWRARSGDPEATIFVTQADEVVVQLSSMYDTTRVCCRWQLYPEDDFTAVRESILQFLRDCRVSQLHALPNIVTEQPRE